MTPLNKKLLSLLQLLIGAGLIAFIFCNMKDKGDLLDALRTALQHWVFLTAGFSGFFFCILFCTARWQLLLKAQGIEIRFWRLITLYFVGQFFNAFLLGATGGDFVKAYFVTREAPNKKTEAVSTVFIDRIIGLLGLMMLTVLMMIFRIRFFLSTHVTRTAFVFMAGMLFAAVIGLMAVFHRGFFERSFLFRKLESGTRFGDMLRRAYDAFHVCVNHRGLMTKTIVLSFLNHIMLILGISYLGAALEIQMSMLDYATVFPVINTVAAIPVTPQGLGTREATAKFLLATLGVPDTRAVFLSLLVGAVVIGWSLIGGVVYIFFSLAEGKPSAAGLAAMENEANQQEK